jgi:hypothetical protein
MAVERPPSAIGFTFRIKMQHQSRDFAPISTFRIRVEQAQIRDDVLFVVNGQYGVGGRGIGDIGIKRRLLHGRSCGFLLGTVEQIGRRMEFIADDLEEAPKYRQRLKHEMWLLVCTDDKKYSDLRKKLEREGGRSQTAMVGMIAAAVAGTVGVMWGALIPFVAMLLAAIARLGKNAYCSGRTLDIRLREAKLAGDRARKKRPPSKASRG